MKSHPYDAILIQSYGGPRHAGEIRTFLDHAVPRKLVPDEYKEEIARRYAAIGGTSPLLAQMEALKAALEKDLAAPGIALPVYSAYIHGEPGLADTLRAMQADGVQRALVYVPEGFSSYNTCRAYREALDAARRDVGRGAPEYDKLRVFYNHSAFIECVTDRWRNAVEKIPARRRSNQVTLFTAQGIPLYMARWCDYAHQLMEACRLITGISAIPRWKLAYQGRIGASHFFWLEPDVVDVLFQLHGRDVIDVVVVPLGFSCDQLEIAYDLDVEAQKICREELGINMVRAETPGTHPLFVGMIRELIDERLNPDLPRRALGSKGAYHDDCPPKCCRSGLE
jgi:ferrochelatase